MENKQKNSKINFLQNFFPIILSSFIIFYFFYGYYTNENSAGAGGYNGDFKLIWDNLNLLREDIFQNIGSQLYNDSRPPTSYIFHLLFNPFTYSQEAFRLSCLFISLLVPILLYFAINKKFPELEKRFSFLLAIIVTLSPYFRTTSYWALGENYGIIFLICTYLISLNIIDKVKESNDAKKTFLILILCLVSSLTIYFDQKLILYR